MSRIVTISNDIKQEIAEHVVEQARPGYMKDYQGEWFVVNGEQLIHRQSTAQWNPWPDSANVIKVDDLVFLYGGAEDERCDFWGDDDDSVEQNELRVEFALGYVPDNYDADDYKAREL